MLKYAYYLGAKLAEYEAAQAPSADAFAAAMHLLSGGEDIPDEEPEKEPGVMDMRTGDAPSWGAPISMEHSGV